MRLFKHLFPPSANRLFPADSLQRIAKAIADSELGHTGEICFAVDPSLHPRQVMSGVEAREQAAEVFARLRVWDTHANNGVLLYLLLADHRIEIVADRGFEGLVSAEQWRGVCQLIEERMRAGEAESGVMAGIDALSALMVEHFPRGEGHHDRNELPDLPYVL